MTSTRRSRSGAPALLLALLWAVVQGCASAGRDFPMDRVEGIRNGETTQTEILETFGQPWRVGTEDGQATWTYGKYKYRLFGQPSTSDLVVRFDDRGVVSSYSFSTTEHAEGRQE